MRVAIYLETFLLGGGRAGLLGLFVKVAHLFTIGVETRENKEGTVPTSHSLACIILCYYK